MMCYRDRTFCTHYTDCSSGNTCDRPLTPEVQEAAEKWWGSKDAPIAVFIEKPKCHSSYKTKSIGQ